MDAMKVMLTRRSIRKYTKTPVSDSDVNDILHAAMQAPSAGDQRAWRFFVVRDKALLKEFALYHKGAEMAPEAPVAVLVCGDTSLEKYAGLWVQDCSAATQNLLLAAHAKGLGAVWTAVYPSPERIGKVQKLLGLPANVIPLALVPIGHPGEKVAPEDRFDKSRIKNEKW